MSKRAAVFCPKIRSQLGISTLLSKFFAPNLRTLCLELGVYTATKCVILARCIQHTTPIGTHLKNGTQTMYLRCVPGSFQINKVQMAESRTCSSTSVPLFLIMLSMLTGPGCSATSVRSPTLTLKLDSTELGDFSLLVNGRSWLKSLPLSQIHANGSFLQLIPDKLERHSNTTASIDYRVSGTAEIVLTTSFTTISDSLVLFEQCIKRDLIRTALFPSNPNQGKDVRMRLHATQLIPTR